VIEVKVLRGADGSELPLLVSSLLPVRFRHGFTTRAGGVSEAPFATLNLGWKWGDRAAAVAENHRRLLAITGATVTLRASQVHGVHILTLQGGEQPDDVAGREADGLASAELGLGLSVHVADCTPILMACPVTGACAALHAGWRSTVAGMAAAGVRHLARTFGCRPGDLRVAQGPCIGACCFEVGAEVAATFVGAVPGAADRGVVRSAPGAKPHVDLRRFQRLQLEAAGVRPEHIDTSSDCTVCDPGQRFFSYRRAGRATGQSVGFIVRVA
jgi:YfiH family protein